MAPTGIIDCDRREMNGEELAVSGGDRKGRDSRRQRLRQQAAETKTAADHQGDMTTEQVARLLTILKY